MNAVEWRVSPQVFSDLHSIIAKHGIGLQMDAKEQEELFPSRFFGSDAAALEIMGKYGLRPGITLNLVVDYSIVGYEPPKYEYGED